MNKLIVQKDGFLCAAFGTKLSITLNRKIGSGLLGGEGFILQKLEGDGKAFIHAGGTVIERQLNNETLGLIPGVWLHSILPSISTLKPPGA